MNLARQTDDKEIMMAMIEIQDRGSRELDWIDE